MSGTSERLAAREPALEWARRSAAGELDHLDWVEAELAPTSKPFSQQEDGEGSRSFRHLPYTAFLPPPVAEAAQYARGRGQATMHEALQLVFARLEWLLAARRYLWAPVSSDPLLLAQLAEAFGVGQEIHRHRPDVLARLAALLPTWHPARGTLDRALEVIDAVDDSEPPPCVACLEDDGEVPEVPELKDEVFRCRDAEWWRRRRQEGAAPRHRIEDGLLRFQPDSEPAFALQREDVLLEWDPDEGALPRNLMRLLPVWCEVRLVATRGS